MKRKYEETKCDSENSLSFGKKAIRFLSKISQGFYFGNDNIDNNSSSEFAQKAEISKSTINGTYIDAKDLKKFLSENDIKEIKLSTPSVELVQLLIKVIKEGYQLKTLHIILEINILDVTDHSVLINETLEILAVENTFLTNLRFTVSLKPTALYLDDGFTKILEWNHSLKTLYVTTLYGSQGLLSTIYKICKQNQDITCLHFSGYMDSKKIPLLIKLIKEPDCLLTALIFDAFINDRDVKKIAEALLAPHCKLTICQLMAGIQNWNSEELGKLIQSNIHSRQKLSIVNALFAKIYGMNKEIINLVLGYDEDYKPMLKVSATHNNQESLRLLPDFNPSIKKGLLA